MKYMLLIYTPESPDAMTAEPDPADMKPWFDYDAELRASGDHVAGDALLPTPSATTGPPTPPSASPAPSG